MAIANGLQGGLKGIFRLPKTILGFFSICLGILALSIYALIRNFSEIETLRIYVPWLLIFGACIFSLVLLAVFITALIKPEKLMLGEIRGEVYLQMLKLWQGDSLTGEIIEDVSISPPRESQGEPKQLLSTDVRKEDDGNV